MRLLRKGKVKEVFDRSPDTLLFRFTDQISVFDKIIPTLIPKKGETLCRTSAFFFREVEKLGIRTHFLSLEGPQEMVVKKVRVISDYAALSRERGNYLIPLEVITRHYVAGSLADRIESGSIDPVELGFPKGHTPRKGEKLPKPFVEFTTKLEKVDRPLTEKEALEISHITPEELDEIRSLALRIDERISQMVGARGLIHVDGKKEFAFDSERRILLVDTFGTADEDRFWDRERYERGELVELSKEFVRQHYRKTGYHEALMEARRKGLPEPPIPPLPPEVVPEVTRVYVELFERITGEKFPS